MNALSIQLCLLPCFIFTAFCDVRDAGQFYIGNSADPSKDPWKTPYLNEGFFSCNKEGSCTLVSKETVPTENWKKFNDIKNIARGKSTNQSSTWSPDTASSKAVDGNRDGHFYNRSCSCTEIKSGQWWMLDFGRNAVVYSVNITNRSDCCLSRLRDFSIKVGDIEDQGENAFCRKNASIRKPGTANFKCDDLITGRYLYIITNFSKGVTLCEVEVFGKYL